MGTQVRCLLTKQKKKQTKTYPEQAKFESSLSEVQAGIHVFFSPTPLKNL